MEKLQHVKESKVKRGMVTECSTVMATSAVLALPSSCVSTTEHILFSQVPGNFSHNGMYKHIYFQMECVYAFRTGCSDNLVGACAPT